MSDETAIHDLGYRRYEGARVGGTGAWRAIYVQGVRTMFGLGRPAKSKILPVLILMATLLPALAMVAAVSASQGQLPVRYGPYLQAQAILFVFFIAAQAPELLSRDQQHRLLPLLLTREVTRASYAWARLAAITTALFVIALAPLLLLYIGEIGAAKDPATVFEQMGTRIWPMLLQSALTSITIGGVGAAFASLTSRRAYATASIIGVFLVAIAISSGLDDLTDASSLVAQLLNPLRALGVTAYLLFAETTRGMELEPPASVWVYASALVAIGMTGAAMLHWRVRRMVV